jgi:hypothetical protein
MKRLGFAENEIQVKAILEDRNTEVDQWVALTPQAVFALESRKIAFDTIDDYADIQETGKKDNLLLEKLSPYYFPRGRYLELVKKYKDKGIVIDVGGYYFRSLVAQFDSNITVLNACLDAETPDEIIYCQVESSDKHPFGMFQVADLNARCLAFLARKKNIPTKKLVKVIPDCKPVPQSNKSNRFYKRIPVSAYRAARLFLHRLKTPKARGDRRILFLSLAYDLEFLASRIIKQAKYPSYLYNCTVDPAFDEEPTILNGPSVEKTTINPGDNRQVLRNTVDDFWGELKAQKWFRSMFEYNNLSFFELLEDKLEQVFREDILKLNLYYLKQLDMLQRYSIQLILTPYPKLNQIGASFWYAAEKLGIPIIVYQHGSLGFNLVRDCALLDFMNSDLFLAYGNGLEEQLKWSNIDFRDIEATGSLKLSHYRKKAKTIDKTSLRKKLLGRKYSKLVTFAPDSTTPIWRGLFSPIFFIQNYSFQKRVVKLFSKFSDILFVFKLSRADTCYNPIGEYITSKQLCNCVIRNEPLLTEYMMASDLVIHEGCSTKTLEALSINARTCCFTYPWMEIYPPVAEALERCMLFSTDEDYFLSELEKKLEELSRGELKPPLEMDPTVRDSIIIDDDKVMQRVMHALEKFI